MKIEPISESSRKKLPFTFDSLAHLTLAAISMEQLHWDGACEHFRIVDDVSRGRKANQ